jgi:hypothetical protein
MVEDGKGLYARAHQKILDELPYLKGEALTREQWHKLCNLNPNNPLHIPLKDAINRVLYELSQGNKNKLLEKVGSKFKVVDDTLMTIDFKNPSGYKVDLVFPFGIHKYCFLYRKNIMVVFGSKDAGKTAFLLNFVRMNMNKNSIYYFSSEMVADEMAIRLAKHSELELKDWNFEAKERSYDFDQVIFPDAINIIDFLEMGGDDMEYYKGVALIRKIYDKLNNGVAIIALQKNKDAEYPKGGQGMLEKSRIAVSLDPGKATLTVCKNWCEDIKTSPRGKNWSYKLVGGINYVDIRDC